MRSQRKKDSMNHLPTFHLIGLAGLGALLAAPALGQDSSHYYLGAGAGIARTANETARTTGILLPGVNTLSSSSDRNDNAFKVFVGYQINRNIALETGYYSQGKSRFTTQTSPSGSLSGSTRVRGLNFDVVGTVPFTERFAGLARVGVQQAWSEARYSGTGAGAGVSFNSKHNNTNYKVGLGAQFQLNQAIWVRGEMERYRVKDITGRRNNIDVATVSLVFPFGRAAAPRMAAAPAYVAPMPVVATAAPVTEAVPAPVPAEPTAKARVPERVRLSADALFGSNQSAVQQKGQNDLDQFSRQLSGATYDSISVTGHTDRMGSNAANQALSEARAASVKDYLVVRDRIDPARISATGMSETQPVTALADCSDSLSRARLIECLQPDRRVDIEVTGTR
jgi:OmpA-OmpF porin, OOP family